MDNSSQKAPQSDWAEALKVFARLSVWIVFPVLIGALIGKWLDKRYDSSPKWFLIIIGLSFVLSMVGLVKNTLKEYQKIAPVKKEEEKNKSEDNK
jgi:F0F1-type ATP synthase assembly protein I